MGLEIQLQDEHGSEIATVCDFENLLDGILSTLGEQQFPMLGSIDRYGDTTFNRIQMPRFLTEWAEISNRTRAQEEQALVSAIEDIARRCMNETHYYVKFIGD